MRGLLLLTCLFSFIVIVLGAYVRLSDAGLGCPDWPGCYGRMTVPASVDGQVLRPLDAAKAWKEMIHRYVAGTLGLLILLITILAWVRSRQRLLATFLLLLVIFQAMLGMWTVTLLLHPLVVMGHLLGGFATLALLWWMTLSDALPPLAPPYKGGEDPFLPLCKGELEGVESRKVHTCFILAGLVILILQISLGGWTSANYAAFACPDFPTCQGDWLPQMNVREAFNLGAMGLDYEYGVLDNQGRVTIQMMHRIGAYVTVVYFLFLSMLTLRGVSKARVAPSPFPLPRGERVGERVISRFFAYGIMISVICQFVLGMANVLMVRPLMVGVAHTAVAALMLVFLIGLIYSETRAK